MSGGRRVVSRWPALLGVLGAVGVVFALLDLILALFGAPIDPYWAGGNLTLGLGLLVAAAVVGADSLRERLGSGEARRASKYGTSALLTTLLSIAILGGLAFLSTRYQKRFDWSEAGIHSLSDQSRQVLEGLDRDVEALALYPELDAGPVRQLLERYRYLSERFSYEVVDPNERPDLLERHGITRSELGQGLVRLALGEESTLVKEPTEESLTNAMVKLTRTGDKKVYFLLGHNERAVEGEGAEAADGYGRAADALRNENYQVGTLLLATQAEVPEDADVVVVAGPTRPLLSEESEALDRYLRRGGALFALLDPRANTNLAEDLRRWGVEAGDDIVIDRVLALFGQAMTPIAQRYGAHPITEGMSERDATLFHAARSVRGRPQDGADLTEIVLTGENSWAETDMARLEQDSQAEFGDGDLKGPVPIAVAGTLPGEGEAEARLVAFGDADFASNEMLESYRNRDLFLNSVNWLLGDVEAISIRPATSRASRFRLSQEDFLRIRSLSLFVLPEAIAVLGVVVWWSRRWSPGR